MDSPAASPCGVTRSILGQPWRWRGLAGGLENDRDFRPDALVDQLLMARGCTRDLLERHRMPTIRGFMPDPSIFLDMDRAAERLADAIAAQEPVTIFGDYDVDGATSAALLIRLLRDLGLAVGHYIPDRLLEGYGPSADALVGLAEAGARLVVTVDCGALAFEALGRGARRRARRDRRRSPQMRDMRSRLPTRSSTPTGSTRGRAPHMVISPRSASPSCSAPR